MGTGKGALPMDAAHTMGLYVGTRGPVYFSVGTLATLEEGPYVYDRPVA